MPELDNSSVASVRGGRRRRRSKTSSTGGSSGNTIDQKAFTQLKHSAVPTHIISEDELEAIHNASLKLLQQTGIKVLGADARAIMKQEGAEVDEDAEVVRFAPEFIMECISTIPSNLTMHARNPAHNVQLGGDNLAFDMMASAPNVSSMEGGRRSGNRKDFRDLLRLSQMHNILHLNGGYPVEPVDIHPSVRHLEALMDVVTLTDKAFSIYSLGSRRNQDGIEIARIARGVSSEQLMKEPSVFTVINTNSPLQLDIPMMQGIIETSKMGQLVVVTPFTLSGAMAPVTLAGALVLQNAEALAGLAFTQMVRKGAPAMYGGFTSNVDMKTGSPAFGTPEYMKAQIIGGQLARKYDIPYRTSNVCAANTVDAQAAYESVFSLWGAIASGMHMLKHGAGWMEGGLCCSFEKTILDIDLLQMVAEFLQPIGATEADLALDAIAEVGYGGHFFGVDHTKERYRDAFYNPILSDWRNFETWQEAGSETAFIRANRIYKERLAMYEEPQMDEAIRDELEEFVARRVSEGGVATDF